MADFGSTMFPPWPWTPDYIEAYLAGEPLTFLGSQKIYPFHHTTTANAQYVYPSAKIMQSGDSYTITWTNGLGYA